MKRAVKAGAFGCVLLMGTSFGCGGEEEAAPIAPGTPSGAAPATPAAPAAEAPPALPPAPPMPTITLSPEDMARATEIAPQARAHFFPSAIGRDKTLAKVFLYLAATSDNDDVVVSSLAALPSSWSVVPRQIEAEHTGVTDEFVGVISTLIRDPRPRIQAAAIDAGGLVFRGNDSNETLVDTYLAMAAPSQPAPLRYAVLNEVWQARQKLGTPERIQPFLDALDAEEPWLVSMTLWRLEGLVPRDASFGAAVRAKALEHTRHADAGVRGRAIGLLARLTQGMNEGEPERVAATARALEMLTDDNPFTKSAAMAANATLSNISAIHAIVPHLADSTRNTYDITGWTTIAGSSGRVHHDGSAWSEVRDSALNAIKSLSRRHNRETMLEYPRVSGSGDERAAAFEVAVTAANAWYEANRATLPE